MTMNKTIIITTIILLMMINIANAIIIESTTANDNDYQNGDLIIITIETNTPGLEINADFQTIDSNFNAEMTVIEEEDKTYTISYPITFSNNKGDGNYNAIINLYDPITSTTNSITYGINLNNQYQRQEDSQEIILTIEETTEVSITDGYIQICKQDTCELITEKEYDASRNLIITSGTVSLSNLTYNQIVNEVKDSANEQVRSDLQKYLLEISRVKQVLEDQMNEMKLIIQQQANITNNTQQQANKILRSGTRNNIISIILVIILILAFAYTIYVRTETTWMNRS